MRFLIRVLVIFVLISAGLSIIRSLFAAAPRPQRLVKDPVCGTYVPEDTALRAGENFFCSEECRGKFLRS